MTARGEKVFRHTVAFLAGVGAVAILHKVSDLVIWLISVLT